jgi:hypothetical protein
MQLLCAVILLASQQACASINKIDSEQIQARGSFRLVYAMLFKLHDSTLYTDAPKKVTPTKLLSGQYALRLDFTYLRTIKKSIILKSADKMLQRNLSPAELASITDRVLELNAAYTTVQKGDHSSLSYRKGHGTKLEVNNREIITIDGDDFGPLYFRIWLGERPISTDMRDNLLGL